MNLFFMIEIANSFWASVGLSKITHSGLLFIIIKLLKMNTRVSISRDCCTLEQRKSNEISERCEYSYVLKNIFIIC